MPKNSPKTLIEVALPLPEINDAPAYDKKPGIGPHPKANCGWVPMGTGNASRKA